MDNSLHTTAAIQGKRKRTSPIAPFIRGIASGAVFFVLSILLIPLILSKTDSPESYITAAAAATVSVTALAASFAANLGNEKGFVLTGSICALSIILILVILSLIFGKSDNNKNYLFSAVIYIAVFVFSILGAKLSSAKKKHRRRKR